MPLLFHDLVMGPSDMVVVKEGVYTSEFNTWLVAETLAGTSTVLESRLVLQYIVVRSQGKGETSQRIG
jgi:hypothetical protein